MPFAVTAPPARVGGRRRRAAKMVRSFKLGLDLARRDWLAPWADCLLPALCRLPCAGKRLLALLAMPPDCRKTPVCQEAKVLRDSPMFYYLIVILHKKKYNSAYHIRCPAFSTSSLGMHAVVSTVHATATKDRMSSIQRKSTCTQAVCALRHPDPRVVISAQHTPYPSAAISVPIRATRQ